LEDHVKRDKEDIIISKRQREDTLVTQLGCLWSVRCNWKDIGRRGSGQKGFVISVNCLNHVRLLIGNPLFFSRYRHALKEYQDLIGTARKHRKAVIPYFKSRRVLESKDFNITISFREYYNSVRKIFLNKNQP
jgi:hypothetical protein